MAILSDDFSVLAAAAEAGARVAVVAGARAWTFGEMADRASRILSWLDAQGRPRRVALVPRLDLASVSLLHALLEDGITAVLLHPRLTAHERAELVRDASPDLVLEDVAAAVDEALSCSPRERGRRDIDPESCLAVIYTSGTTGRAKGALLSRRAFRASAEASAANLGWQPDDRWLLCMPLAHVGGLSIVIRCLLARKCVVLPDTDRFDGRVVRTACERDQVTIVSLVPTMLARMVSDDAGGLPSSLRVVMLGGAASSAPLLDDARRLGIPALTTYGLTEACSQVATQTYGTPPGIEHGSGPPVLGTEVRIVDGRVEVRGPTLMSGYRGDDGSGAFLVDGEWLRTDDFGELDEQGRLHLLGRKQELLVTGGENVYPLEVERALEALPGVAACCVFGTPDATWGEIVSAAIVWRAGARTSLSAFAASVAATLAPHKLPRRIAEVESLVATAAGKLDRAATARAAAPLLVAVPPADSRAR